MGAGAVRLLAEGRRDRVMIVQGDRVTHCGVEEALTAQEAQNARRKQKRLKDALAPDLELHTLLSFGTPQAERLP
jgi:6-phosphofructokinase